MKKILLVFLLVPIASFFVFVFWVKTNSQPVNPKDTTQKRFVVVRGWSATQVGNKLKEEGLIKSPAAFKLYAKLRMAQQGIIAGEYRLSKDMSLPQIFSTLLSGPSQLWVTLPEGLRREEVAARVIKVLEMEGETAGTFWQEFLKESEDKEGFLFPDTYLFPRDVQAKVVVVKLRSTFDQKVTAQMLEDAKKQGLTTDQFTTLASIVEKETKTDGERPIVAGILAKRLKTPGWRLQADATLQYITGGTRCGNLSLPQILVCDWWKPPTADDKSLKSPYNTYTSDNLPPSPIANPGLSSIKAVVSPEDSPYWYYLHDNDGKIHYAKTIEEHTENINRYLR